MVTRTTTTATIATNHTSHTYGAALGLIGTEIPPHLEKDAHVPVLTGPQSQGDVMLIPVPADEVAGVGSITVPAGGVQVIRGEATGNTHWLHQDLGSTGVQWAVSEDGVRLGYLMVPEGQVALLIHTEEHGVNAAGPGCYRVNGKREQLAEVRRVAD